MPETLAFIRYVNSAPRELCSVGCNVHFICSDDKLIARVQLLPGSTIVCRIKRSEFDKGRAKYFLRFARYAVKYTVINLTLQVSFK